MSATRVWTCGCSHLATDPTPWRLCERHATSHTRPDLTALPPRYDAFVGEGTRRLEELTVANIEARVAEVYPEKP